MNVTDPSSENKANEKSSSKKVVLGVALTVGCLIGSVILIALGLLVTMAGGMAAGSGAGGDMAIYNAMCWGPLIVVPLLMVAGIAGAIFVYKQTTKE